MAGKIFDETPDVSAHSALQRIDGALYGLPPSRALDALSSAVIEACMRGRMKDAIRYAEAMERHIRTVASMEVELTGRDFPG